MTRCVNPKAWNPPLSVKLKMLHCSIVVAEDQIDFGNKSIYNIYIYIQFGLDISTWQHLFFEYQPWHVKKWCINSYKVTNLFAVIRCILGADREDKRQLGLATSLQNLFVMYLKSKSQFLQFKLLDQYLQLHD